MNKIRILSILTILVMLCGPGNAWPAVAQEICTSSGYPSVSTDKADYSPLEVVIISGSGFGCGVSLAVLVTAPDGSTRSGDGTDTDGPVIVTADESGAFVLSYSLSGSLPDGSIYTGQQGQYTILVVDSSGTALASATFSDSMGHWHSCALTVGGGVKCWGYNDSGQLGNGTTSFVNFTPADVFGLTSGAIQISDGGEHTCALMTGGTVKCWGGFWYNDLGDDAIYEIRTMPVDVIGLTDVIQISAGYSHVCALMEDGTIKCWGGNWYGQLGNPSPYSAAPVDVLGLTNRAIQISAGGSHTCALMETGGVKCWGSNWLGQLGNDSEFGGYTPVDVVGLETNVIQISAGGSHTCALTVSGGVLCWGKDNFGQLGDDTLANPWLYPYHHSRVPVQVVGLSSGVSQISAGGEHSCALKAVGSTWCWGLNDQGQVGDGTYYYRRTVPRGVYEMSSGVIQVSAGGEHTCAMNLDGGIKCWGSDFTGQLGSGTYLFSSAKPVNVYGMSSGVASLPDGFPINLPPADGLFMSFLDPVADNTGAIDVVKMEMVFDNTSGNYEITLIATEAKPFFGQFRVNVNLYNPDTLLTHSGFSDYLNDFNLTSAITRLTLTGTNAKLLAWDVGDRVATTTAAGLGNPPGVSFFRSSVLDVPFDLYLRDDIAFGLEGVAMIIPNKIQLSMGGPYLEMVNVPIQFDASNSYDQRGDPLSYAWEFGDGSLGDGAMPIHSYLDPGIYDVCLTVTSTSGEFEKACTIAVIYNPAGGFVIGGGWIDSVPGSYLPDPSLTGKAAFGFVSEYKKDAKVPTGQTEFQFKAAALNFHSTSYQWLVVNQSGTNVQFKGEGTINGELAPNGSPYKFMIWATDQDPALDTFRIKIWYEAEDVEIVVYDNGFDQQLGGGSIQILSQ